MKRSFATIVIGALALLQIPYAQAATQQLRTTTVSNHTGNSTASAALGNRGGNSGNTTSNGGHVPERRVVVPAGQTNHGSNGAKKTSRATCSCGCGGTPRPFCAYKDCSCGK